MKSSANFLLALTLALVAGCGGSDDAGMALIQASDADAVSTNLGAKVNDLDATRTVGQIPAATSTGDEPLVQNVPASLAATNGGQLSQNFSVDANSPLLFMFLKVVGSDDFFQFDISGAAKATTNFSFNLSIPSNISDGQFCIDIAVQSTNGAISQAQRICIDVESTADDPVPSPTPPPASGDNSARACFNPNLYAVGSDLTVTYRENISFSGGDSFTEQYTENYRGIQNGSFNGRSALEVRFSDDFSEDNEYYQINASVPSITYIGYQSVDGEQVETLNPGHLLRFNLAPGESYSYSTSESYSEPGFSESGNFNITVTYTGRERVTVEAGTFDTCRFSFNVTGDSSGGGTVNIAVGSGVDIAFDESGDGDQFRGELVSATLNGAPIN